MTASRARRVQIILSVAFLCLLGVISIKRNSFLFLLTGLGVVLFISSNLWVHKKTHKITRETWLEYIIVGLMVLLLAYSASR